MFKSMIVFALLAGIALSAPAAAAKDSAASQTALSAESQFWPGAYPYPVNTGLPTFSRQYPFFHPAVTPLAHPALYGSYAPYAAGYPFAFNPLTNPYHSAWGHPALNPVHPLNNPWHPTNAFAPFNPYAGY